MHSWLAAGLSFIVAAVLTAAFVRPGSRFHILDRPNERSLHTHPRPRTGGVAILAGILAGGLAGMLFPGRPVPHEPAWLAGLAVVLASVSFIDDRRHLSAGYRIMTHLVVAALLVAAGFAFTALSLPGFSLTLSPWLATTASVLFIVWMINLYNFMDGMDGLAGGMAVFGFGSFAVMGWMAGHDVFLVASLVIASSAAGFLVSNFPPAKIFMGDTGSSVLGMLAAALALWGVKDGVFPFWIAVLVFSPFIMDATVTLLRRLWRREKIWEAHKTHYYQALVQAGWGHRKTALVEYVIMGGCGATAILSLHASSGMQVTVISAWALFYLIFFFWVSRHASGHRAA